MSDQNDPSPAYPDAHVKFGTQPSQVIPLSWANLFLTILYREHPQVFGKVLVQVVGAELPEARRRRPSQNGAAQ